MRGVGVTVLLASFISGMAGNVTAFNPVWTCDRMNFRFGIASISRLGVVGVAVVAMCLSALAQDSVSITEFMASNLTGLRDEDGDTSDWIELQNTGTNTVNLANWTLTDSPFNLQLWAFPATT